MGPAGHAAYFENREEEEGGGRRRGRTRTRRRNVVSRRRGGFQAVDKDQDVTRKRNEKVVEGGTGKLRICEKTGCRWP